MKFIRTTHVPSHNPKTRSLQLDDVHPPYPGARPYGAVQWPSDYSPRNPEAWPAFVTWLVPDAPKPDTDDGGPRP